MKASESLQNNQSAATEDALRRAVDTTPALTRIVIAGGGFAGLYAAMHFDKRLAHRADVEVTLISHENFILFTPTASFNSSLIICF